MRDHNTKADTMNGRTCDRSKHACVRKTKKKMEKENRVMGDFSCAFL